MEAFSPTIHIAVGHWITRARTGGQTPSSSAAKCVHEWQKMNGTYDARSRASAGSTQSLHTSADQSLPWQPASVARRTAFPRRRGETGRDARARHAARRAARRAAARCSARDSRPTHAQSPIAVAMAASAAAAPAARTHLVGLRHGVDFHFGGNATRDCRRLRLLRAQAGAQRAGAISVAAGRAKLAAQSARICALKRRALVASESFSSLRVGQMTWQ